MQVTYQSQNYDSALVVAQYLGMSPYGIVKLYEVNAAGRTVRETVVNLESYDGVTQHKVKESQGRAFNQVRIF